MISRVSVYSSTFFALGEKHVLPSTMLEVIRPIPAVTIRSLHFDNHSTLHNVSLSDYVCR